jgi:chromosome segregation ATPase
MPSNQNSQGMEIRTALERLKYELGNHDKEIQVLDQKFENLQEVIQGFRSLLTENHEQHQELVKTNSNAHELRLDEMESTVKKMLQDLKGFQTTLNNSTETVLHIEQKMNQLTRANEIQSTNMENMQAALTTLLDALQIQPIAKEMKLYEVKDGDSLGKIAQNHKTSVKALKELNGLTQDRIKKGQKLKLPQ